MRHADAELSRVHVNVEYKWSISRRNRRCVQPWDNTDEKSTIKITGLKKFFFALPPCSECFQRAKPTHKFIKIKSIWNAYCRADAFLSGSLERKRTIKKEQNSALSLLTLKITLKISYTQQKFHYKNFHQHGI